MISEERSALDRMGGGGTSEAGEAIPMVRSVLSRTWWWRSGLVEAADPHAGSWGRARSPVVATLMRVQPFGWSAEMPARNGMGITSVTLRRSVLHRECDRPGGMKDLGDGLAAHFREYMEVCKARDIDDLVAETLTGKPGGKAPLRLIASLRGNKWVCGLLEAIAGCGLDGVHPIGEGRPRIVALAEPELWLPIHWEAMRRLAEDGRDVRGAERGAWIPGDSALNACAIFTRGAVLFRWPTRKSALSAYASASRQRHKLVLMGPGAVWLGVEPQGWEQRDRGGSSANASRGGAVMDEVLGLWVGVSQEACGLVEWTP